ncbi:MAG: ABC transporter ATP-binding protein [Bacteroidales bacterium]|nr:ABC transporter ATP-binding protein [Candidatus Physcocola equi]
MSKDLAIEISHLFKTYRDADRPAVNDLSLSVEQGDFFGLLGANGAGKTTTLSILCGLIKSSSGEVRLFDKDVNTQLKEIKPMIGVVPQEYALYPELTALENLQFFGGVYGLEKKQIAEQIEGMTDILQVKDLLNKRIARMSGGEKRRFNLMAGLLHRPKLLFLDEPTVGIDVKSQQIIIDFLRELNREGMTIIYTSHLMAEAETLCNHVAVMVQGRKLCDGCPSALVAEAGVANLHELCLNLMK